MEQWVAEGAGGPWVGCTQLLYTSTAEGAKLRHADDLPCGIEPGDMPTHFSRLWRLEID